MGWSDCGSDSNGRPMGYSHDATCDHPGCSEKIDRGLAYACGGMHGEDEISCERYFCEAHRSECVIDDQGSYRAVCDSCAEDLKASGFWNENEDGEIERIKK